MTPKITFFVVVESSPNVPINTKKRWTINYVFRWKSIFFFLGNIISSITFCRDPALTLFYSLSSEELLF